MQLFECATQAVELVHKMKDDVDAFVVDSETSFQIPDQTRSRESTSEKFIPPNV